MKKILMLLAAVSAVGIVQASTVKWSATGFTDPNGTKVAGMVGYLFLASDSTGDNATLALADAQAAIAAGKFDTIVDKAISTGTSTKLGSAAGSVYDGGWVTGDSISYYAIVFDAASAADASNVKITSVSTYTYESDAFQLNTATPLASSSWTSYSQGGGGSGGIPEPTSGLLLLIGGSLLALRRKQK